MTEPTPETTGDQRTGRRTVLIVGGATAATVVVAACGDDAGSSPSDSAPGSPSAQSSTPSPDAPPASDTGGPTASDALVEATEVPVGSGVVLADDRLVVTQPTAGEFRAFSAVCTHQGCAIASVSETIDCTCHGSRFAITDGAVVNGPATQPLPSESIVVEGGAVRRGSAGN